MHGYHTQYGGNPAVEQYGMTSKGYGVAVVSGPPVIITSNQYGVNPVQAQERKETFCTLRCHRCLLWTFIIIFLASVGMLIAFGACIAAPYYKALTFSEANCTVNFADIIEGSKGCSCGKNCRSSFPCSMIRVTLVDVPGSLANTQLAIKHTGLGSACSVHPLCDRSESENYQRVLQELKKYTVNSTIDCFYNPKNVMEIFEILGFNETQIIMFLVGPSVGIILGALVLYLVYRDVKAYSVKDVCCAPAGPRKCV